MIILPPSSGEQDAVWYAARYASPVGELLLASRGEALTGLWLEGQRYYCAGLTGEGVPRDDLPVFAAIRAWLDAYFRGENPDLAGIPLAPEGTPFQREVWRELLKIPYGGTDTYGGIAARLQRPSSARAVGGAVGRNPISILIPCHRVLGADGSLTGYAGGVERKRALLALEGISLPAPAQKKR